ncbi:MAG: hypothetical protein QM739_03260 [Propionivibrio sp.]
MRHYPSNSPEAMTRVVALALLADGAVDPGELEVFKGNTCRFRLGIDPCRFEQTVDEFRADVLSDGKRTAFGKYGLSEGCIRGLLAEISDPNLRKLALGMMLDVAGADGALAREEKALIAQVVDCWQLGYRAAQTIVAGPDWQAHYRRTDARH